MRIVNPIALLGEQLAVDYLVDKGYVIIERNYRKKYAETDIIAIYKDTLVFIEVKTRTSNEFGTPFEAITLWKLKCLIRSAQLYSQYHPKLPEALRIDAVAYYFLCKEDLKRN